MALPLVGRIPEFVNAVIAARNELSHGLSRGEERKSINLFFLSRQLEFILKACFAQELGLPLERVTLLSDYDFECERQEKRRN